jgi:hypothetical protein
MGGRGQAVDLTHQKFRGLTSTEMQIMHMVTSTAIK